MGEVSLMLRERLRKNRKSADQLQMIRRKMLQRRDAPGGIPLTRKGAPLIERELQRSSQLLRELLEVLQIFCCWLHLFSPSSGI